MKVAFLAMPVHPRFDSEGMHWAPHTALYYLGRVMRESGIETDIIDPDVIRKSRYFQSSEDEEQVVSSLLYGKGYDAVLFSATTLTWGIAKRFIEHTRRCLPDTKIIVGGVHARYLPEYILSSTSADIVVPGEGEISTLELVKNLLEENVWKTVPGIVWKETDGSIHRTEEQTCLSVEDMTEYPVPDFQELPRGVYETYGVETSRGCMFSCLFCSVTHRHNWRGFPAEIAIKRVTELYDSVKPLSMSEEPHIYFVDDCFTADTERAISILEGLHKIRPNMRVTFEARVTDMIRQGIIDRIPLRMVNMIQIGVECGYNEGLKKIRKGITVEQLEECVQILSDYDLQYKTSLSFIIGFPWETLEDIRKTVNMVSYLCSTYGVLANLNWLWLMPSDLWKLREDYGITLDGSMFDDPLWFVDKKIFFASHPNICEEDVKAINEMVARQHASGVSFAYSSPI